MSRNCRPSSDQTTEAERLRAVEPDDSPLLAGAERSDATAPDAARRSRVRVWATRLGVGYLIFCAIKGLAWLALGGTAVAVLW